ncbi:MAG TPA: deoxyhypusine synthase [Herpetosiphonaceae bacterium]
MQILPPNIILFGPPGAGKSTQAAVLAKRWSLQAISTGQRLRDTAAAGSELGRELAEVMAAGLLVGDELMNRLLREWLGQVPAEQGVLLDGYPRTVAQAEALAGLLAELNRPLAAVVALSLSDEEAVRRLSGRRICQIPGQPDSIIHISDTAAIDACLAAGGTLVERLDDAPESITQRLAEYNAKTEPLLHFYGSLELLSIIDADGTPDQVAEAILAALPHLDDHIEFAHLNDFPAAGSAAPADSGGRMYGRKLDPTPIGAGLTVRELVDSHFFAYNAARLREACHLLTQKIVKENVTLGVTLSGALTPTGLGYSALVPLVDAGAIDWIVSTGANLYHDLHRSLGFELFNTSPNVDDLSLREQNIIRIYDILFDQEVLLKSDAFLRTVLASEEFQRPMSTAELHYLLGKYVRAREQALNTSYRSLIGAAYEAGVPIYTSSPGDSTIGMNVAAMRLAGGKLAFDVEADVNETTAIVYDAKASGGQSAVLIFGGGSPKNFILQTEPQIQEIMGIPEKGHDYFIQITDARVDTGGLSGATPSEAMTWGKVDPEQLPDTIVCYTDSTIAMPIIAAYVLETAPARPLKRLFDRRAELSAALRESYAKHAPADDIADLPADHHGGTLVGRATPRTEEPQA